MSLFFKNIIIPNSDDQVEEQRLQREVVKILFRASIFTGLLMGTIFLLQYEVEDERPELSVAIFTFSMAFIYTLLIWLFNVYILNFRILPFISHWTKPQFEFILRGCISLLASSILMSSGAEFDKILVMEFRDKPNIFGLMQVRGFIIVAISLTITWGIAQALAQQRALNIISKLREENFQAKFEVLKQQVNPHFLFNSLNILKGMIRTQNTQAEDFVVKLSDVYRYILQSNTQDLVTISEELTILNSYFFMLKSRFRDSVNLDINISKKTLRSKIPPLTLQILVENCVKHNILTRNKPLNIAIFEDENYIIVQNNLQIKNALATSTQLGLNNIMLRYYHVNEQKIVVETTPSPEHESLADTPQYFTVKLPILK
jgi:two-component system, LytTR family, sensor kinase